MTRCGEGDGGRLQLGPVVVEGGHVEALLEPEALHRARDRARRCTSESSGLTTWSWRLVMISAGCVMSPQPGADVLARPSSIVSSGPQRGGVVGRLVGVGVGDVAADGVDDLDAARRASPRGRRPARAGRRTGALMSTMPASSGWPSASASGEGAAHRQADHDHLAVGRAGLQRAEGPVGLGEPVVPAGLDQVRDRRCRDRAGGASRPRSRRRPAPRRAGASTPGCR